MTRNELVEQEEARLAVLRATGLLDSSPDREFEAMVSIARELTGCKHAAISLVDHDRQWFLAEQGLGLRQTPREHAFCAVAVEQDDLLVVGDASRHPRFRDYPMVSGKIGMRYYAGMPLRLRGRPDMAPVPLGTICISDDTPREPNERDLSALRHLAILTEGLIRARFAAGHVADLLARHESDLIELTRAHVQFTQAERLADIGSWRLSLADQKLEWSDGVFAIHGLPHGVVPKIDEALAFYPPQSRATLEIAMERTVADGTPFDLEVDFIPADGELHRVRVVGECERVDGEVKALFGVFQDVSERYREEQALRRSAMIDELTGIANRAAFNAELDQRIVQAREVGEPLALVLIDLDGFKAVNDRCGHLAGDEVLQTIAQRLARRQRAGTFPARLGGDEFVLLVDDPPGSTAFHATVEALLADLRLVVPDGDGACAVTGTIGISWFDGASSRRDMLNRADQALYAAKQHRKGTGRVFGSDVTFGDVGDAWPRRRHAAA